MSKEIIKGNILIAEFMGMYNPKDSKYPFGQPNHEINYREAQYHSSWDWLMPVVEKIWKLGKMICINFYTETNITECKIYNWGIGEPQQEAEREKPIEAVWLAVVEFIKWYNQNK